MTIIVRKIKDAPHIPAIAAHVLMNVLLIVIALAPKYVNIDSDKESAMIQIIIEISIDIPHDVPVETNASQTMIVFFPKGVNIDLEEDNATIEIMTEAGMNVLQTTTVLAHNAVNIVLGDNNVLIKNPEEIFTSCLWKII